MRILKISQTIIFKEDTDSGNFKRGEKVTFSGYIQVGTEIIMGYMKQEPINDGKSITLYVKGHNQSSYRNDVILLQTTKINTNINAPITMCSYFPSVRNGKGKGYVDEANVLSGIRMKEDKYFFIHGDYIAESEIQIEGIPDCDEYKKAEKKINQMLNRLYLAKKQGSLNLGHLFDYIKPHWGGALCQLIHVYPNKPH